MTLNCKACLLIYVSLLVGAGVAWAAGGDDLVKAAAKGDIATVRSILSGGVDVNAVNKNGDTALMEASRTGKSDVVALLIQSGANVNAQNKNGATPAMRAVFAAQAGTLQQLVDAGADLLIADNKGKTPFLFAVENGTANVRPELMPIFAKAGVNVDKELVKGEPPLIHAVNGLMSGMVKGLMQAGADPNIRDSKGRTALNLAIKHSNLKQGVDMVALIVAGGADLNFRDEQGRTPLEYAVDVSGSDYRNEAARKNHGMVVYILASRGANEDSIAAARKIIIAKSYVLFDTMIIEGRKKFAQQKTGTTQAQAQKAQPSSRKSASAPPPGSKCAGKQSTVKSITSSNAEFQASLPLDLTTIQSAKARMKDNGNSMKVFLANQPYSAQQMDSSMVIPVSKKGEAVVVLKFMNGSNKIAPGTYKPAAGWGKPGSIYAEVQVKGTKQAGTVVTFVTATSSDQGAAAITAIDGGFVCGTFDIKGGGGALAGEFVAEVE